MHSSNVDEGTIPELRYDHRDINMAQIVKWVSIFLAFVVICIFAAMASYKFFTPDWKKEERALPLYVTKPRVPPFPQLQADPKLDMELYKAAEAQQLGALARVKKEAAERGISGVGSRTGSDEKVSFPGSGDYKGMKSGDAEH